MLLVAVGSTSCRGDEALIGAQQEVSSTACCEEEATRMDGRKIVYSISFQYTGVTERFMEVKAITYTREGFVQS